MPVREALHQLTNQGILEKHGQQCVVAALGADDLEDVHTLTAVLHGWAAGRVATMASDSDLADLAAICHAGLDAEDPYEWARLAMQFHRKINLLANSSRLVRTLAMFQQTSPRAMPFNDPEMVAESKELQLAILRAIESRDSQRAEEVTRSQGLMTVKVLREFLATRNQKDS
jgi:DNA-binding GntR family transcriptional regulator